jgi:hypothetical protein
VQAKSATFAHFKCKQSASNNRNKFGSGVQAVPFLFGGVQAVRVQAKMQAKCKQILEFTWR